MNNDHLIKYGKCFNNQDFICLNLLLLTNISYSRGYRQYKSNRKNKRLNNLWKQNHPILSKFYKPYHTRECLSDRWVSPSVNIYYGTILQTTITFKSNADAKIAHIGMETDFWKYFIKP